MKEHVSELRKIMNKWDIGLIIIILLIALFFIIGLKHHQKNDTVQVFVNNNLIGEYDLSTEQLIDLGNHNIVEIKNNKVRMKKSSCKNQLCVKQGWSANNPIICVPNKVAVKLKVSEKKTKNPKMLISY